MAISVRRYRYIYFLNNFFKSVTNNWLDLLYIVKVLMRGGNSRKSGGFNMNKRNIIFIVVIFILIPALFGIVTSWDRDHSDERYEVILQAIAKYKQLN